MLRHVTTFIATAILALVVVPIAISEDRIPVAELAHVHGVAFDPSDPKRVLLATHFGIYAASDDGMATLASATEDDFMGFSLVPGRTDRLVASGHPMLGGNMGFIASVDGGVTWEQVSLGADGPVDFHALTVSSVDPSVMYGLFKGIQASSDGGRNWTIVGNGSDATIDLAASAVSSDVLFAATGRGLFRSGDGGAKWAQVGPAVPVTMVETGPDGSLYIFVARDGLYRGDSLGEHWSALNTELAGREFLHLAIRPDEPAHLVAVTHASEVLESHDGGKTWLRFGSS
jgi:photosystem II stability/assembly factor-like uncharacterized protein